MTAQDHKAIARRFFEEVWNQQKLEVVDEIFAPTLIFNGTSVSREVIKQLVTARRAAFPDIRVTVDDQVAEGDKVSTRRTWEATHQGPYRGIAATGKRVKCCATCKHAGIATGLTRRAGKIEGRRRATRRTGGWA